MSDWSFNDDVRSIKDALHHVANCIDDDAAGIRERAPGSPAPALNSQQAAAMTGVAHAVRRAANEYRFDLSVPYRT